MELSVSQHKHDVWISIRGSFDAHTAPTSRSQLDQVVESKPPGIVLDMSDTSLIDSTGVGGIVSLYKRTRAYGGQFSVVGVNGQPQ
ncbi:MAG: hypothetical protein RJA70_1293, partial [Pseudomonadota bacterium]